MTKDEEIDALKQQLVTEQKMNKRTLDVIELVQIRLAALDDEYRRLVGLTTSQERNFARLSGDLDLAKVENDRLREENASLRKMLAPRPVESSPLTAEELDVLYESEPE